MRGCVAATLVAMMLGSSLASSPLPQTIESKQQAGRITGVARAADNSPVRDCKVRVRNANTGQLSGEEDCDATGAFMFGNLQPGSYVVELVDASGKIIGVSPAINLAVGASVSIKLVASAAGAMTTATGGGFSLFGLGPLASVAVIGAAGAAAVAAVIQTRDGKVVICHRADGQPPRTITVDERARESHLGHGDTLGACPASPSR